MTFGQSLRRLTLVAARSFLTPSLLQRLEILAFQFVLNDKLGVLVQYRLQQCNRRVRSNSLIFEVTVVQVEREHRFGVLAMALCAARLESNENRLAIRFGVMIIGSVVEVISSTSKVSRSLLIKRFDASRFGVGEKQAAT